MPVWFQAITVLVMVWVLARLIKRNLKLLQRYFIPSSIIGGALLLLIGPQVVGVIPESITKFLSSLPALLINIVFAGLFLGQKTPGPKKIWQQSGPMIAFGSSIAWGMYVFGILLTLLVLTPLFGAPAIFGSLLEISLSGGHGTAAGLAPMFNELGYPEGTDIALGLATVSIIAAVVIGIAIINIHNRKAGRILDRASMQIQQKRMIRNGYDLTRVSKFAENNPKEFIFVALLFCVAIGLGIMIQKGLVGLEDMLLQQKTDIRMFAHLPLFPLAMFGGLIVQIILRKLHLSRHVDLATVKTISAIALDLLIITAIGTVSLFVLSHNLGSFILLALVGIAWILFALWFFASRFFKKHWFEYGMTDMGQAMGTTATGLLLNRLVDPTNRTGAREAFAYKQLAYEPFMGGGIVTAMAAIMLVEVGQFIVLGVSTFMMLFWIIVGMLLGGKKPKGHARELGIGKLILGTYRAK